VKETLQNLLMEGIADTLTSLENPMEITRKGYQRFGETFGVVLD
jgi:hypothetical protein